MRVEIEIYYLVMLTLMIELIEHLATMVLGRYHKT